MSPDFQSLADHLLADALSHLEKWLPAGKLHGREYRLGSLRGEVGQSLAINIDTGIWSDFSTQEAGGDLISLYAAIYGISQGDAFKDLGGQTTGKIKKQDEYLPGVVCRSIPKNTLGKPTHIAEYKNTAGHIIGYICRFEPPNDKKQHLPLSFWKRPDGTCVWKWKKWPILSPVYHADRLAENPGAPILIVEGEKKADRAQLLLPNHIVVGWCGGAEAIKKTDWSPLQGRTVWIWPDADRPGLDAADGIKKILPTLHIVDIAHIVPQLPEGWDLGDAPDGFDPRPYMVEQAAITVSQPKESTLPVRLDRLNSEYAVIMHGSKVLIMRHWLGEDGQSKIQLFSQRDFMLWQENNVIFTDDDKVIKVGKSWLEWKERQQYEEVYFEPCGAEYKKRYNLWRGFAVTPAQGDCSLFLSHIRDNICGGNPEYYAWTMAWLADLFQRPARKLGTALVLRGPMGIGKGVFANHIGHLLGKHYMPISQRSQLIGKFNSHMADKLMMFVDEGWWSDDSNYGVGVLRGLITEPQVSIEMKGKDAVTLANYTRFIIAANADWVVPVSGDDERRFTILDAAPDERGNKPYFKAINEQMKNGGYEALLYMFLNHKYDESVPGKILKTPALYENKIYSIPDEMKWWHGCLLRGIIGDFTLREDCTLNDMRTDLFYGHYLRWCQNMSIRPLTDNILPKKLKSAIEFNKRERPTDISSRDTIYCLKALSDLRRDFESFIGHKIDWNE